MIKNNKMEPKQQIILSIKYYIILTILSIKYYIILKFSTSAWKSARTLNHIYPSRHISKSINIINAINVK